MTAVGGVKCWGYNGDGEIGVTTNSGTTNSNPFAVDVANFGSGTAQVFGKATYSTPALTIGSHSISAAYGGDGNHNSSTSPALTQSVNQLTTTGLTSSQNPSGFGVAVAFTATVSSSAGTPTGSVAFKDGASTLGNGTLLGGIAMFNTSSLSPGDHTMTAVYSGDGTFAASTSAPLTQTAGAPPPNTLLVSPATNMSSSGNQGGAFSPSSFQYQLSASSGSINYSISGLPARAH